MKMSHEQLFIATFTALDTIWCSSDDCAQQYSLAPYRISRCEYGDQLLLVTHDGWP